MQKKLLTVAIAGALAAPAAALAQVEVYSTIHMSMNKMKYGEATGGITGSVSKWDVASHASNIGVRARENIGGGQTAWIQVETNASMERSNNDRASSMCGCCMLCMRMRPRRKRS